MIRVLSEMDAVISNGKKMKKRKVEAASLSSSDGDLRASSKGKNIVAEEMFVKTTPFRSPPSINLSNDVDGDGSLNLLERLLFPVTLESFYKRAWQKRCWTTAAGGGGESSSSFCEWVDVERTDAFRSRIDDLVKDWLCGLDVQELVESSASENVFVWSRHRSGNNGDGRVASFELDRENQSVAAVQCYLGGSSLYFRSSDEMAAAFIPNLCHCLGFGFGSSYGPHPGNTGAAKGEIEIFLAQKGHKTGWHMDFMENFTVQIAGTKRWTVHGGPSSMAGRHPLRGWTPHFQNLGNLEQQAKVNGIANPSFGTTVAPPEDERSVVIELGPGDVLYHPAGIWHKVEATSDDCVSINFSLFATSWGEVIRDYMHTTMMRSNDAWRSVVGIRPKPNRASLLAHVDSILDRLRNEINSLTAAELLPPCLTSTMTDVCSTGDMNWQNFCTGENSSCIHLSDALGKVSMASNMQRFYSDARYSPCRGAVMINFMDMPTESLSSDCIEAIEQSEEENAHLFGVHTNFGNEELNSQTRVLFVLGTEAARLCKAASKLHAANRTFTLKEMRREANVEDERNAEEVAVHLLSLLCYAGFISLSKK